MMEWQVGDLFAPVGKDEFFDDEQMAFDQTVIMSHDLPEYAFGVWTNDGDELIAIAHAGELFVKVDEQEGGE